MSKTTTIVLLALLCLSFGCSSNKGFVVDGEVADVGMGDITIRIADGKLLHYDLWYPHPYLEHLTKKGEHVQLALGESHYEGKDWEYRWMKVIAPSSGWLCITTGDTADSYPYATCSTGGANAGTIHFGTETPTSTK